MSLRDISPKGQTQERSESHAGQSSVRSSSVGLAGLRWTRLQRTTMAHGSTRLHFPIREATRGKQLGCRIPHIPSISIIHTICSICVNTTWHHSITLWLKYLFNRLRGARYYKHGSHDPTFRAYKSKHKRKLSCLSTDIYKWKRLRSLTIYQILPRAQDRSWGIKLNVGVRVELLARLKSLCKT